MLRQPRTATLPAHRPTARRPGPAAPRYLFAVSQHAPTTLPGSSCDPSGTRLLQEAVAVGFDLHLDLLGLHLEDHLAALDLVAVGHHPLRQCGLLHRHADLRQVDRAGHVQAPTDKKDVPVLSLRGAEVALRDRRDVATFQRSFAPSGLVTYRSARRLLRLAPAMDSQRQDVPARLTSGSHQRVRRPRGSRRRPAPTPSPASGCTAPGWTGAPTRSGGPSR